MFVPQYDDHPVVDDGKDHDLKPDIIKMLCRINHPLWPAEREMMMKRREREMRVISRDDEENCHLEIVVYGSHIYMNNKLNVTKSVTA